MDLARVSDRWERRFSESNFVSHTAHDEFFKPLREVRQALLKANVTHGHHTASGSHKSMAQESVMIIFDNDGKDTKMLRSANEELARFYCSKLKGDGDESGVKAAIGTCIKACDEAIDKEVGVGDESKRQGIPRAVLKMYICSAVCFLWRGKPVHAKETVTSSNMARYVQAVIDHDREAEAAKDEYDVPYAYHLYQLMCPFSSVLECDRQVVKCMSLPAWRALGPSFPPWVEQIGTTNPEVKEEKDAHKFLKNTLSADLQNVCEKIDADLFIALAAIGTSSQENLLWNVNYKRSLHASFTDGEIGPSKLDAEEFNDNDIGPPLFRPVQDFIGGDPASTDLHWYSPTQRPLNELEKDMVVNRNVRRLGDIPMDHWLAEIKKDRGEYVCGCPMVLKMCSKLNADGKVDKMHAVIVMWMHGFDQCKTFFLRQRYCGCRDNYGTGDDVDAEEFQRWMRGGNAQPEMSLVNTFEHNSGGYVDFLMIDSSGACITADAMTRLANNLGEIFKFANVRVHAVILGVTPHPMQLFTHDCSLFAMVTQHAIAVFGPSAGWCADLISHDKSSMLRYYSVMLAVAAGELDHASSITKIAELMIHLSNTSKRPLSSRRAHDTAAIARVAKPSAYSPVSPFYPAPRADAM